VATSRLRPDSLALGLSLIALGGICFLGNLGHVDTLDALRTWWPGSLILWGALELLEWRLARAEMRRPSDPSHR